MEERNEKVIKITGMTSAIRHICKNWLPGDVMYGTEICSKCRRLLKDNEVASYPMDGTILRGFRGFRDQYNIICLDKIHSCYKKLEG